MKALPLFEEIPRLAVQRVSPLPSDPTCELCALHRTADGRVCREPAGWNVTETSSNLLLLGDAPTQREGDPFTNRAGQRVKKALRDVGWAGGQVFDYALRCPVTVKKVTDKMLHGCRGYLAETIREANPARIITFGAVAAHALTGRSVAPFVTRRGYTYMRLRKRLVPVFFLLHPSQADRNTFVRQWFEADMAWALKAKPEVPAWDGAVYEVQTVADARSVVAEVARAEWASFDVETCGKLFDPSFELLSVAICARGTRDAFVFPKAALVDPRIRRVLAGYLADASARKAGSNVKYDVLSAFCAFESWPAGVVLDIRLVRKLLEPEADGKLEKMSELVGLGGMKEENAEAKMAGVLEVQRLLTAETRSRTKGAPVQYDLAREMGVPEELEPLMRDKEQSKASWAYALVPPDVLTRYNARDVVATTAIGEALETQLDAQPDLKRTWEELVLPASGAVARVEAWGIAIDRQGVEAFDALLGLKVMTVMETLRGYQPTPDFNWSSRDQVADLFFRQLRLPKVKLTDGGADSTDAEVLEVLARRHPAAAALMELRSLEKLQGTYARGLLRHIRPDGRIHPTILLDGARSGRASCKEPNLQNQPRPETPEAKMVRDLFIAPPGNRLVSLDYSQLELRVAAMLSGDRKMMEVFESGIDYHLRTAQMISKIAWGIAPEAVEKKHRTFAKTVNFGLVYGKGDKSIAEEFGCSVTQAANIRAAILGEFRDLDRWCKERLREAQRTGRVWTEWKGRPARWRPLYRVMDVDSKSRSVAEHGAVNSPIQGTASDYCLASLTAAVDWLLESRFPAKLCLVIHDALLFEVRDGYESALIDKVRAIMTGHPSRGVRLVVDAEVGASWGSMTAVKEAA